MLSLNPAPARIIGCFLLKEPNMPSVEFLTHRAGDVLRQQIQNIIDSYNHYWDVLAELCQNAIDALIERTGKHKPKVKISFDCKSRSIGIWDNGIGVEKKWLEGNGRSTILSPDTTRKKGKQNLVGSKGVGLTFATFACNNIELITSRQGEATVTKATCDAHAWLGDETAEIPRLDVDDSEVDDLGEWSTKIELRGIATEVTETETGDLFDLSVDRLVLLLRTRTAIGWTNWLFADLQMKTSKALDVEVTLEHTDKDGTVTTKSIPFGFAAPSELFKEHLSRETLTMDAALKVLAGNPKRLKGKLVSYTNRIKMPSRDIAVYALVAPSRQIWTELIERSDATWGDGESDSDDVSPGIWLATRGMPCGIRLNDPSGVPAWIEQMFILIEDPDMAFDVGRKAPAGRTIQMYTKVARKVLGEFRTTRMFDHIRDQRTDTTLDSKSAIADIVGRVPLPANIQKLTGFVLPPDRQEAAVAAMFFHLLGKGELKGYQVLRTSYGDRYDALMRFQMNEKDIEGAENVAYSPRKRQGRNLYSGPHRRIQIQRR